MARQNKPIQPQSAYLTPEQMKDAIPKLRRRIAELQEIDVNTIEDIYDERFNALKQKIDSTLVDIFGNDTLDYERFNIYGLYKSSFAMTYKLSVHEIRKGYKEGIDDAISNLNTIIELFEERIADLGETPAGRALKAYGELKIHPDIECAVEKLFRDGHYANAVENACKVLDGLVKDRSGKSDLSGTDLMKTVFSPNKPILKFNEFEQEGMMYLFAGAMLVIRNPRAHKIIEDEPEKALEYIVFLSLLAKSLDKAKK